MVLVGVQSHQRWNNNKMNDPEVGPGWNIMIYWVYCNQFGTFAAEARQCHASAPMATSGRTPNGWNVHDISRLSYEPWWKPGRRLGFGKKTPQSQQREGFEACLHNPILKSTELMRSMHVVQSTLSSPSGRSNLRAIGRKNAHLQVRLWRHPTPLRRSLKNWCGAWGWPED
jgi:hypothetical protein